MVEVIVGSILLCISLFLAFINWKIYKVTVVMLKVTIDIHYRTIDLLQYTKKTYEVLGGEEGLTAVPNGDKMVKIAERKEVNNGSI